MSKSGAVVVALVLWATARPVDAHHSFATQFDAGRPLDLKGTVSEVLWANPHCELLVDVMAHGTATQWLVELASPAMLEPKGLRKSDVLPGTDVRVVGYRSRQRDPSAYATRIVLNDGRMFQTGSIDSPGADGFNGLTVR